MRGNPSRVTVLSAAIGSGIWVFLAFSGLLGDIELLLVLAPLVLVPVLLDVIKTPTRVGRHSVPYHAALVAQPIAALCVTVGVILPPGLIAGSLAAVWASTTVLLALYGLWRLLPRGIRPVEELLIDAGLLYIPVGGIGLFLNRLGVAPLGFSDALVLLAGVHFHYAGFVLPILTGLSGRVCPRSARRAYTPLAAVVLMGPGLIGLGITFSPVVEVISVTFFTAAVALLAFLWLVVVVPTRGNRLQQAGIALATLVLPASMLLALLFGFSRFLGRPVFGLRIPTMVALHGQLNALGFALLGVLSWRLDTPLPRVPRPGVPFSALTAGRRVGKDYLERTGVLGKGSPVGQIEDLSIYSRPGFNPDSVHPEIRRFYERTSQYELSYRATWHRGFKTGARLAERFTSSIGQLALPGPGVGVRRTTSQIVAIDDSEDGRPGVRGWVRRDRETGCAVFVAAYSTHEQGDETFMNIALPLPRGNLTAVLRIDTFNLGNGKEGIELLSTPRAPGGDPGLYLVTPVIPVRLPVHERFRVWPVGAPTAPTFDFSSEKTRLVARHEMWILGRQFLTLDYTICSPQEDEYGA